MNDKDEKNPQSIKLKYKFVIILTISIVMANLLFIKGLTLPWLDTESQWIGFLGSFFSSIVTIVGIYWTLNDNREQSKEDRRYQNIPYLKIEIKKMEFISNNETDTIVELDENYTHNAYLGLYLKNIGLGPMSELELSRTDYEFLLYPFLDKGGEELSKVEFRIKGMQECVLLIFYNDLFDNRYFRTCKLNLTPGNKGPHDISAYLSDWSKIEVTTKKNEKIVDSFDLKSIIR
jgi:hypothetical protein